MNRSMVKTAVAEACPLSVVMPVFNEEGSIAAAVQEVRSRILDAVPGGELWVVDDGSRDTTPQILDSAASNDARLHVVHQPNGGHGSALLAGLAKARGEWILLVDSDRQIPLDCFASAWERRTGLDLLLGTRRSREDPWARKAITATLRLQIAILFGFHLADANVPFKLVRRSLWEEARESIPAGCLIPSVFLAIYARRARFRCATMDIGYRKRGAGRTSLRKLKLLKFSSRSFGQLVHFRMTSVRRGAAVELSAVPASAVKKL